MGTNLTGSGGFNPAAALGGLRKTGSAPKTTESATGSGGFNPAAALGGLKKTGSAIKLTGSGFTPKTTNSGEFNPAAALGGLRKTGSAAKLTNSGEFKSDEKEKSQSQSNSAIDSSPPRLAVTLRRSGGEPRSRAATVSGPVIENELMAKLKR